MPKRKSMAAWADASEKIARSRRPDKIVEAKRTFLKELTADEQMALAEEIVVTRSAELCRAYPNVVDVAFGYGRRRVKDSKKKKAIRRTPCVTFIVRSKWRSRRESDETLPTHLLGFWKVGRVRKLCAVPTDVEPASEFAKIEPQAQRPIVAVRDAQTGTAIGGTVTCAVKRRGDNSLYALSCRHNFSISKHFHGQNNRTMQVRLRSAEGPMFANTTRLRGKLSGKQGAVSFDAQLAEVDPHELAAFRAALGQLAFTKIARGIPEIPDVFDIWPPRSKSSGGQTRPLRIKAEKLRFVSNRIIPYTGVGQVRHEFLIEVQSTPRTKKGDSGSPAVTRSGDTLLGMNIAGTNSLSYLIPAWQLLDPRNYGRPSEKWRVVTV